MKKYRWIFHLLLILGCFVPVLWNNSVRQLEFETALTGSQSVQLPVALQGLENQELKYQGVFHKYPWSSTKIRIIPDDCLEEMQINGQLIEIPAGLNRCDYDKGFVINLASALQNGDNQIYLRVSDHGGGQGLNIIPEYSSPLQFASLFILLCYLLWGIQTILLRIGFSSKQSYFLCTSVLLLSFSLFMTRPEQFTYDYQGHFDYVKIIAENHQLPKAGDCWQCYQMPAYYIAAVPFYQIALWTNPLLCAKYLQIYSFLLYLAFWILGLMILRESLFHKPRVFFGAALLLSFWPSAWIHSVRVGNDLGYYTLSALFLWACLKWLKTQDRKFLYLLSISALISLAMKSTGMVNILFALCIFTWQIGQQKQSLLKTIKPSLIYSILLVGIAFGMSYANYTRGCTDGVCKDSIGNLESLHSQLKVNNHVANYFSIDLESLLISPFNDPWHDRLGRQNFWTYSFKSSLFGEFHQWGRFGENFAWVLTALFLGFVLIWIYALYQSKKPPYFLLAFWVLALISAEMAFRYKYPYSCSNDFRYIYPLILGFTPLSALALDKLSSTRFMRAAPWILGLWVISSALLNLGRGIPPKADSTEMKVSMKGVSMPLWKIPPLETQQDWSTPYDNKNLNGDPMVVGTYPCRSGISTHAKSMLVYPVPQGATHFKTKFGIDSIEHGEVQFILFLDDREVWRSPIKRAGEEPDSVEIPLQFTAKIRLMVDPLGGNQGDHADWCEAEFVKK